MKEKIDELQKKIVKEILEIRNIKILTSILYLIESLKPEE